ncbi:DUF4424 domain-containing protein [Gellertiella hungarica]|uniref:DUF4424 domain-containing protein n=1 Tax=Gellertiella hungarica TaxID=1572859 RepID=A0A7W6J423_9HYPH|nr:DUF4424 domain-containing protein [Gellertiella hungarica]MBB4064395.1 hypothetical protein [Gellertiella hungarica]
MSVHRSSLPALALALGATVAAPHGALANDTMAVLGAGGLRLATTGDVTMTSEDLYISPDEVRVDYVFTNNSDKDIESVVAFPMPDLETYIETDIGVADKESDNFMNFHVEQDGEEIEPELQQRVIAGNLDVTEEVDAQGVPKLGLSEKAQAAVNKLPPEVQDDWVARGLLYKNVWYEGDKEMSEISPRWTVRSTYWWRTVFPAKKSVTVHHSYKPVVGGTVAMTYIDNGKPGTNYQDYKTKYCIDDGFMKASAKLEQQQKDIPDTYYMESWISYILTTGANWAGPIGDFHLTVDKGAADAIVSFCGKDVKKTGPTTFEMRAKEFFPERDLDILIVYKQMIQQQ